MTANLDIIARLKNQAKAGLTGLESDLKGVDKAAEKTDKKFQALGKAMKVGLVAGAAAAAAGLAVLATQVKKSIDLAGIQQDAETQLAQTLESTGFAAGLTADELMNMASGLQAVTTFGDETIIRGQALLLTFTNIGGEVFPRATESALDMAEVFGSVDSAAIQLGKALNDPIVGVTALQRVGVSFTESQKDQIRVLQESGDLMGAQTIILDELARQFGGQARAAAETFTGRMEQLSNVVGDGYEVLGFAFLPALTELGEDVIPMATEAVETMAASLDTQLIPLGHEVVALFLEVASASTSFLDASDDTMTFEEATRKTRVGVALLRIGVQTLEHGYLEVGTNTRMLVSATDDLERRTNLLRFGIEHLTNDAMVAAIVRSEQLTEAYGGKKTALSELEITSNLYIDAVEEIVEGEEKLVIVTDELKDKQAQLENQLTDAEVATLKKAMADEIATEEARKNAEEQQRLADAANAVAGEMSDAAAAVTGYFQAVLEGNDPTANLNALIWEQAAAAGLTTDELVTLATDVFDYSEAEAEAAAKSAILLTEQEKLITAFGNGQVSVEQLDDAMGFLESGMADTALEAMHMAQTAMPNTARSLGLTEAAALLAKEEILGLNDELGIMVDNSPYEADFASNADETIGVIDILKGKAEDAAGTYEINYNVTVTGDDPPPGAGGEQGPPDEGGGGGDGAPMQTGGYTGPHSGRYHPFEYIFSPPAVAAAGVPALERMHEDLKAGRSISAGGDFRFSSSVTVNVYGASGANEAGLIDKIRSVVREENRKMGAEAEARFRMR